MLKTPLWIKLFIYLSRYLPTYLSIHLSIHLSIYVCIPVCFDVVMQFVDEYCIEILWFLGNKMPRVSETLKLFQSWASIGCKQNRLTFSTYIVHLRNIHNTPKKTSQHHKCPSLYCLTKVKLNHQLCIFLFSLLYFFSSWIFLRYCELIVNFTTLKNTKGFYKCKKWIVHYWDLCKYLLNNLVPSMQHLL